MRTRKAFGSPGLALLGFAVPAAVFALGVRPAPATRAQLVGMPTSRVTTGVAEIGALYAGPRSSYHGCTASVVHSPRGNTLITAAHCVAGHGDGMVFVPAQNGTRAPYGRWTVTAAHVGPEWVTRQDPDEDVAFLTVAPRTLHGVPTEIEQVTGAYRFGSTPRRGQRVIVTGYPAGTANSAITCAGRVYLTHEFPSFDCHGYVGGTSGSPWLRATRHGMEIVGVIGGRNQGGCFDYTSYSSPLDKRAAAAFARAALDDPADAVPVAGGDGC